MRQAVGVAAVAERILRARKSAPSRHSVLAAISGIDGCGKGYMAARIKAALDDAGVHTAVINIDGWLNLPQVRFDASNPARNFYDHAIRFDELFSRLILPLRARRSVRLEADFTDETAMAYRRHVYDYRNVDVILLEGIYLLKRRFQGLYDVSCWIECSFETALKRAISRAQEGLTKEETVHAYRTIFFPAQKIHFRRDSPRSAAMLLIDNDDRSTASGRRRA